MKLVQKIKLLGIALSIAVLNAGLAFKPVFAATGSIYITPASTSMLKDTSLSFSVRINPGTAIDGVENVKLTYDAAKLQYVSISTANSPFTVEFEQVISSGSVTVTRTTSPADPSVTTDSLIMKVTFKAKVGTGSTSMQVSGNAAGPSGYTNPSGGNATVSFTSPAPKPTPAPPPPPSPAPTPTPTPTPPPSSPTPKPTPPPASPVAPPPSSSNQPVAQPQVIEFTKATLSVSTSKPSVVYIKYGLSEDQLIIQTKPSKLATRHNISISSEMLVPGMTFYYKAVAEDAKGKITESPVQTFKTKGFTVKVKVFGKDNVPITNKEVTLNSEPQTTKTDNFGVATFNDVAPGNHTLQIKQGKEVLSQSLAVSNFIITDPLGRQTANPQEVTITFAKLNTNKFPSTVLVAVIVAVVFIMGSVVFSRRGNNSALGKIGDRFTGGKKVADNMVTFNEIDKKESNNSTIDHISYPQTPNPGSTIKPDNTNDKE